MNRLNTTGLSQSLSTLSTSIRSTLQNTLNTSLGRLDNSLELFNNRLRDINTELQARLPQIGRPVPEPAPEPTPQLPQGPLTYRPQPGSDEGASDASTAIALDKHFMVVGDDEGSVLRVYPREGGEAVVEWNLREALNTDAELDLEASTRLGDTLFFIGSHSNTKSGSDADSRELLFSVSISGQGAATAFTFQGAYNGLEADLARWDSSNGHGLGAHYFGLAAAVADGRAPERNDGFAIEGMTLAPDNSTLWLALRAPQSIPDGMALIVPLQNAAALLAGSADSAAFAPPIQLDLGGRGIRSIEQAADGSGYLIIAGPAGAASSEVAHNFRLFSWSGDPASRPLEHANDLDALLRETGGSFEALDSVASLQQGSSLQLLQDNGDTLWAGETRTSKDLPVAEQRFVGQYLTLGEVSDYTRLPAPLPPVLPEGPAPVYHLLISEVNSNASGGDFVELYNHGSHAIDLSGWRLTDEKATFDQAIALPDGLLLEAGQTLVIALVKDAAALQAFKAAWSLDDSHAVIGIDGPGLGKQDAVVIFDAKGYVASAFNYDLSPVQASDGSLIETAASGTGITFMDDQHAGAAYGGGAKASVVWDGLSTETPTWRSAVVGEQQAYGQSNDPSSIGSPGSTGLRPQDPSVILISQIQGHGDSSPIIGQNVTVEARITAWLPHLNTFYIEEERLDHDGDVLTSEGVAVFYAGTNPGIDAESIGDLVRFDAAVGEHFGLTQLSAISNFRIIETGSTADLDPPTRVYLPIASGETLERFEGMRVEIAAASGGALHVADTYTLARYGELTLYADAVPFQYTEQHAPSAAGYSAYLDQLTRSSIQLDDGRSSQNPSLTQLNEGARLLRDMSDDGVDNGTVLGVQADGSVNFVRVGDTTQSVSGVLGYSFGHYELHPTEHVQLKANLRPDSVQGLGDAEVIVGSFNVLNYFNSVFGSASFTTPAGNSIAGRGASNAAEFAQQQAKLVEAILATGAHVLGLNELQNNGDGPDSAIASLVGALNAAVGSERFAWIGGHATGSDAIRVGILYDQNVVQPLGLAATPDTGLYDAFASANRLPVAQTFAYRDDASKQFTLVVNHLKSKGSAAGLPGDTDQGDGQGNSNATRVEAVKQLDAWLNSNPTGATDGDYLLVGDLNAYRLEDPVTTLEAAGYTHHGSADGYSYVFDGLRGSLDHILSKGLSTEEVTGVSHFNINADEQLALDYNDEFGDGSVTADLDRNDPYRSSDHDPVLIGLKLQREDGSPAPVATPPGETPVPPAPLTPETGTSMQSAVFISELHYDNASTDVDEGLAISGAAGTDLTGWSVVLYNGTNGTVTPYGTLALNGVIDNEGQGFGELWFGLPVNGLQNGANDGLALVDADGQVVQFLSYEGRFTATSGAAAGMISLDIGVSEDGNTAIGHSLQLVGSGRYYEDFSWVGAREASPGSLNSDLLFV